MPSRYLSQKAIKPGCIYATSTGVEYLYLGHLNITQKICVQDNLTEGPVTGNSLELGPRYVYVRMTETNGLQKLPTDVYAILNNAKSLDEFVDKHIETLRDEWRPALDLPRHPKKLAKLVSRIFENQTVTNGTRRDSKTYDQKNRNKWYYDIFEIKNI